MVEVAAVLMVTYIYLKMIFKINVIYKMQLIMILPLQKGEAKEIYYKFHLITTYMVAVVWGQ
jgi:hypothetical protein